MKPKKITPNADFVGRTVEIAKLEAIGQQARATILMMYGRRRVGKTEILERTFKDRNILKFEGIEGQDQHYQRTMVMQQLAEYAEQPLLREVKIANWADVFKYIVQATKEGEWTIYFEEVQWLADYQDNFIGELKYAWDNFFRQNPRLLLILCGSAPSFMIKHVVHSKSLYNRSQYEMALQPLSLIETKELLPKCSQREVMDAYLTVGGIPEYLYRLKQNTSVFLSVCEHSFKKDSFFSREYNRIFISSLAKNAHYKMVIDFLSKRKFAKREDIVKSLKAKSGGRITELLQDLELSGFIIKYAPYNLNASSKLTRYAIKDAYLQFYYKFIKPNKANIDYGQYDRFPERAINKDVYHKWLGFSFERFCRENHPVIASILGFASVRYRAGAFYNRATDAESPGYQIDLIFDRDDHVITLCEIKYTQTKVSTEVIAEFERKCALFNNPRNKTLHKVLITIEGTDQALIKRAYFDRVITIKELFKPQFWE